MIDPKLYARYLHWRHHRVEHEFEWPCDAATAWRIVKNEVADEVRLLFDPFKDYRFRYQNHTEQIEDHDVEITVGYLQDYDALEGLGRIETVWRDVCQRDSEYQIDRSHGAATIVVLDESEEDQYNHYCSRKMGRPQSRYLAIRNRQDTVRWVDRYRRGLEDQETDVTVSCDVVDFLDTVTSCDEDELESFVRSCLQSIFDLTQVHKDEQSRRQA